MELKIGDMIEKFGTELVFLYTDKYGDLYFYDTKEKRQRIFDRIFFKDYIIHQNFN